MLGGTWGEDGVQLSSLNIYLYCFWSNIADRKSIYLEISGVWLSICSNWCCVSLQVSRYFAIMQKQVWARAGSSWIYSLRLVPWCGVLAWPTLGKMAWKTGCTEKTQLTQSACEAQFKAISSFNSCGVGKTYWCMKDKFGGGDVRKRNCPRKQKGRAIFSLAQQLFYNFSSDTGILLDSISYAVLKESPGGPREGLQMATISTRTGLFYALLFLSLAHWSGPTPPERSQPAPNEQRHLVGSSPLPWRPSTLWALFIARE